MLPQSGVSTRMSDVLLVINSVPVAKELTEMPGKAFQACNITAKNILTGT
jgi:hypothetical protein